MKEGNHYNSNDINEVSDLGTDSLNMHLNRMTNKVFGGGLSETMNTMQLMDKLEHQVDGISHPLKGGGVQPMDNENTEQLISKLEQIMGGGDGNEINFSETSAMNESISTNVSKFLNKPNVDNESNVVKVNNINGGVYTKDLQFNIIGGKVDIDFSNVFDNNAPSNENNMIGGGKVKRKILNKNMSKHIAAIHKLKGGGVEKSNQTLFDSEKTFLGGGESSVDVSTSAIDTTQSNVSDLFHESKINELSFSEY